jgi:hypothetical protein
MRMGRVLPGLLGRGQDAEGGQQPGRLIIGAAGIRQRARRHAALVTVVEAHDVEGGGRHGVARVADPLHLRLVLAGLRDDPVAAAGVAPPATKGLRVAQHQHGGP